MDEYLIFIDDDRYEEGTLPRHLAALARDPMKTPQHVARSEDLYEATQMAKDEANGQNRAAVIWDATKDERVGIVSPDEPQWMGPRRYIELGANKCPRCMSDAVHGFLPYTSSNKILEKTVMCNDCAARWVEQYGIIGYEGI